MPTSCRPCEPDQVMLLPAAPQEWLPAGHLAHFINDTVDALDLKAFYTRYEGGGSRNQPFHPAMMAKVLVYAYATGVFSSRRIERWLHEDLGFRMLAAGNFPRHRTIWDFRAFHLKELSELFVQVVRLAREMGLVKLGTVAIDRTKLKANASRHKAISYERMKQTEAELKAQIDALLARAKATDEAEVNEPELDLPTEIERREARLAAIREARQRLLTVAGALEPERIMGVETGGCPQTAIREDASINLEAVDRMLGQFPNADIVFIESGGDNLAATFSPELSDLTVYVIDVAAGEKIPRKGGPGITKSDLFVINKTDLAPHVGADLAVMEADTRRMRPDHAGRRPYVMTNLKTREGLAEVVRFIETRGMLTA